MADISDVLGALAGIVAATVYPNGTTQASAAGFPVKVYPGWPVPAQLQSDLVAGSAHVSLYPTAGEENTTRYFEDWQQNLAPVVTLTAALASNVVTLGGTVSTPAVVTLLANGSALTYAVQATDTLASIATALAGLVAGATAAGNVVTYPLAARVLAVRVSGQAVAAKEVRRQRRRVQIVLWAATPAARDTLARLVDPTLASQRFFQTPDGSACRLIYQASPWMDSGELANVYRRDLIYSVEYPTLVTETETQIGTVQVNDNLSRDGTTIVQTLTTFQ